MPSNQSVSQQLTTVIDFIRYCATQMNQSDVYFGHGTDNAWDDALALVMHVIDMPIALGQKVMHARLLEQEKQQILTLLQQRIEAHIPLPYLTNHSFYCGLDFYVDERVLIPRSPIAELIETQFEPWLAAESVNNILELCTGSGCISIAMAYAFENASIIASDISEDALAVAAINVDNHGVEQQLSLIESDVYQAIPEITFDLIVANPPYVSHDEMATLPQEFHVEPELALAADNNGLDIVNRILQGAKSRLSEHGILVVEVGNSWQALEAQYPTVPFTWLEFERGGDGVFLLTYQQLHEYF